MVHLTYEPENKTCNCCKILKQSTTLSLPEATFPNSKSLPREKIASNGWCRLQEWVSRKDSDLNQLWLQCLTLTNFTKTLDHAKYIAGACSGFSIAVSLSKSPWTWFINMKLSCPLASSFSESLLFSCKILFFSLGYIKLVPIFCKPSISYKTHIFPRLLH